MSEKKKDKKQTTETQSTDDVIFVRLTGRTSFEHGGRSHFARKQLPNGYRFGNSFWTAINHPIDVEYFLKFKKNFMEIAVDPEVHPETQLLEDDELVFKPGFVGLEAIQDQRTDANYLANKTHLERHQEEEKQRKKLAAKRNMEKTVAQVEAEKKSELASTFAEIDG